MGYSILLNYRLLVRRDAMVLIRVRQEIYTMQELEIRLEGDGSVFVRHDE